VNNFLNRKDNYFDEKEIARIQKEAINNQRDMVETLIYITNNGYFTSWNVTISQIKAMSTEFIRNHYTYDGTKLHKNNSKKSLTNEKTIEIIENFLMHRNY